MNSGMVSLSGEREMSELQLLNSVIFAQDEVSNWVRAVNRSPSDKSHREQLEKARSALTAAELAYSTAKRA
jgi:hypothetical protein